MSGVADIVGRVLWAKCATTGAAVWLKTRAEDTGMDMAIAKAACDARQLVCPDCDATLTPRRGVDRRGDGVTTKPMRRSHFTHHVGAALDDASCPGAARMTAEHLLAQERIARVLDDRHPGGVVRQEEVSVASDGRAGRADVALTLPGGDRLCVEVQLSSLAVADLQLRTAHRESAGYAVEWVFIQQVSGSSFQPSELLREFLERRGYIYLLPQPRAPEPVFRVAIHGDLAKVVPDLRGVSLRPGHVHVLRVPRPLCGFTFTGRVAVGAGGLRCERLHRTLAGWMTDRQVSLERVRPDPVPVTTPAADAWRGEHRLLERAAEHAAAQCREGGVALHAAAAAIAELEAAAEEAEGRVLALPRWRWRKRPLLVSLAERARDDAAAARDRVAELQAEVTRREADHRAAIAALEEHSAGQAAAKQADEDRHAEAVRDEAAALLKRLRRPLGRVTRWQLALPR
jgi:hypothetical protein